MIQYTERLHHLMTDIVARVPTLSFINPDRLLVFARAGRTGADGAVATCHCLSLPPSEPGYYFWRDRDTGRMTRRTEWFVTKSPVVQVGGRQIDYMISVALPRFCDQSLTRSRKQVHYPGERPWMAKLDTLVHELYHIDPAGPGIRRMERADGTYSANCHGGRFFEHVVEMVKTYLATDPDPSTYDFLRYDHRDLASRFGGVAATVFRRFPSYPRRYEEVLRAQPSVTLAPDCRLEPLRGPRPRTSFTEQDLVLREFSPDVVHHRAARGSQAYAAMATRAPRFNLLRVASDISASLLPLPV